MNRNVPVPFLGEEQRQRWLLTRLRAVVPKGARAGTHVGRVLARASGSFDLRTKGGRQAGISYRYCRPIHRNDGYSYQQGVLHAAPATQSA